MNKFHLATTVLLTGVIVLFAVLSLFAGPDDYLPDREDGNTGQESRELKIGQAPLNWPQNADPDHLGRFFRTVTVVVSAPASPTPQPAVQEPEIRTERISWISFVGTMTDTDGQLNYYFKNDRTGRIESLVPGRTDDPWTLKTVSDSTFILTIDGSDYEIQR